MSKFHLYFSLALTVMSMMFVNIKAHADDETWVSAEYAQARLYDVGNMSAIHVRLSPGWHTYWRVPGDAGLPPRFTLGNSENVKKIDVLWPAPKRIVEADFQTFGYDEDVIFPIIPTFKDADKPAKLNINLAMMVCRDICVPQTFDFSLEMNPPYDAASSNMQTYIKRMVPVLEDTPVLKIESVVTGPDALVITAYSLKGFDQTDIFASVDEIAFTLPPEIIIDSADKNKAIIKIAPPAGQKDVTAFLTGKALNIVLRVGQKAVEKTIQF